MNVNEQLTDKLKRLKPALEASLDCIAMVNTQNEIVFANTAMRSLLGLRGRDFKKTLVFCEQLKLSACESICQIKHLLQTGKVARFDELPAVRGTNKLRVGIKGVPIFSDGGQVPIGAIITVRDNSGEILLQAKYHKLLQILAQRTTQVEELAQRVRNLEETLRRGRQQAS